MAYRLGMIENVLRHKGNSTSPKIRNLSFMSTALRIQWHTAFSRQMHTKIKLNLPVVITLLFYVMFVPVTGQNHFPFYNWFQNFQNDFQPSNEFATYRYFETKSAINGQRQFAKPFKIIWNVPSFQCHKYGLNFSQVSKWEITQNSGDSFRGDKIALLYDPGLFPALLETTTNSEFVKRNGGVPQEGDFSEHLRIFTDQLDNKLIPDKDFSGLAIIDFEHWRPIWNENFGSLNQYRQVSRSIEHAKYPFISSSEIDKEAAKRFEKAAWQFLKRTLKTARFLRPKALWGYYGFPLCFNYTPRNQHARCTNSVMKNNERMKWLFEESSAVYPSLYYKRYGMNENSRASFMDGRMSETMRLISMSISPSPVYPYTWLKYYDTKEFVNQNDLLNSFLVPRKAGAAGVIIWGATNDVNTKEKCRAMNEYVDTILGPTIQRVLEMSDNGISIAENQIIEEPVIDPDESSNVDSGKFSVQ